MSTPLPVLTSNGRSTAFCLFTPDFGLRRIVLLTGFEVERRKIVATGDEVTVLLRRDHPEWWSRILTTMATQMVNAIEGPKAVAHREMNELLWERDREMRAEREREEAEWDAIKAKWDARGWNPTYKMYRDHAELVLSASRPSTRPQ